MSDSSQHTKHSQASSLTEVRRKKIEELLDQGIFPYSTGFKPEITSQEFLREFRHIVENETVDRVVKMSGRIIAIRLLGKAAFMRIRDVAGDFQIYLGRDAVGAENFKIAKKLDIGDIIGVVGKPFKTRTGETSVLVEQFTLLTKALRPLPEKWHGLSDVETRYRQRYLDLIVNQTSRDIVITRSKIISFLRNFLTERGFLEVETPMMQALPGGATAKPFETYHNALDRSLYLRIAPELYLKRLLVGGFDKVFEINRNFRNEGISTQHNPEFTMLEFYEAYKTYDDLMSLTEQMLSSLAQEIIGTQRFMYGDKEVDLTPPWTRMTVREALITHRALNESEIDDWNAVFIKAVEMGLKVGKEDSLGKLWMSVFDEVVEEKLWGPVFIHKYPVDVSPLARRNDEDPTVTDRFELYICGREMANAFTELNDPIDQRSRFEQQVMARNAGDEEAHYLDEDFLRALEYGMPPAAGEGLGIDRIVMLLTNSQSIREVILFPHMRPEKGLG
ncbi:MAG: lysine--tRNA ligase [Syntrophaceae bacterium]|nr:lysine--tRNA ligase [Syntrophaceae bacterium]